MCLIWPHLWGGGDFSFTCQSLRSFELHQPFPDKGTSSTIVKATLREGTTVKRAKKELSWQFFEVHLWQALAACGQAAQVACAYGQGLGERPTRQIVCWESFIDHPTRMRSLMRRSTGDWQKSPNRQPLFSLGTSIYWMPAGNTTQHRKKQSKRFLVCVERNFLTQLVKEFARGGLLLGIVGLWLDSILKVFSNLNYDMILWLFSERSYSSSPFNNLFMLRMSLSHDYSEHRNNVFQSRVHYEHYKTVETV